MKMKEECLPCLVNQVIKVANITHATNREKLYQNVFTYLSNVNFEKTNPEIIGETFSLLKKHIGNTDPYKEIRNYYNNLFLKLLPQFDSAIHATTDSFREAIKYAIVGNIIDFNPIHSVSEESILEYFTDIDSLSLTVDSSTYLQSDLEKAKVLLYLGDNCGEICLDLLLIKQIKKRYPNVTIYFGVRGEPVVNDSIEADAYFVGIDQYATIISNGDQSLGTVLSRTSDAFKDVYNTADVIIAKGQANYESLSDEKANIYFLLMTKCQVIAEAIGIAQKSLVCLSNINHK